MTQLKDYFMKRRDALELITKEYVVVVSFKTADGGKPGVMTEVTREIAAHLLAEGRARLANVEEAEQYYSTQEEARKRAEEAERMSRIQVQVVSELTENPQKQPRREKR
jgi:predicted hydrocarbon binding protein